MSNLRDQLKAAGISPNTFRGQHFLSDVRMLDEIVELAGVGEGDVVVEVGPGPGTLTERLLGVSAKVVAVEVDDELVGFLHEKFEAKVDAGQLQVVKGDVRKLDVSGLVGDEVFSVVGNIPYYLTSNLVRRVLLDGARLPESVTVLIQEEVARRMVADASEGDMNLLGLLCQLMSEPVLGARVPAGKFFPPPKVESRVVKLGKVGPRFGLVGVGAMQSVMDMAQIGFQAKRKKLSTTLVKRGGFNGESVDAAFLRAGLDGGVRPDAVSAEQWVELCRALEVVE